MIKRLGADNTTARRDEALKNSALWMRCRNINRGLIHLLRFECRSRGTMQLSIKCYLRGLCLGGLHVWA